MRGSMRSSGSCISMRCHIALHIPRHIPMCALARMAFALGPNMLGAIFMRLLCWGWSRNLMMAQLCQLLFVSQ